MQSDESSVAPHIDRLRGHLSSTTSEVELEAVLGSELEALRRLYRENPARFGASDVEFLQGVRDVHRALEAFIEIVEELPLTRDLGEAHAYFSSLKRIAHSLGEIPVRLRVLREVRALRERLPDIEQMEATSEVAARRSRILELEAEADPCACGRRLIVRESEHGSFWGCESFPACWKRRPLSLDERRRLHPAHRSG